MYRELGWKEKREWKKKEGRKEAVRKKLKAKVFKKGREAKFDLKLINLWKLYYIYEGKIVSGNYVIEFLGDGFQILLFLLVLHSFSKITLLEITYLFATPISSFLIQPLDSAFEIKSWKKWPYPILSDHFYWISAWNIWDYCHIIIFKLLSAGCSNSTEASKIWKGSLKGKKKMKMKRTA